MFSKLFNDYRQKSLDKEKEQKQKSLKNEHEQRQKTLYLLIDNINIKISEYFDICDQEKEFSNLTEKLYKIKNQNNIEIIIMKSSSGNNKPPFSLSLFVKKNENSDFQISFQDYTYNKPEMTNFVKEGMEIIGFIPDFYDSFIARSSENPDKSSKNSDDFISSDEFIKSFDNSEEFISIINIMDKFCESKFPKILEKLQADIDDIDSYNEKLYTQHLKKFNEMSDSIQKYIENSEFKKVDNRNFEFGTHNKNQTLSLN